MKYKKILVTGADGFIGSHLVELLVKKNYEVTAFVFYNSFSSWGWLDSIDKDLIRKVNVIPGDIRDNATLRQAMIGVDAVIHLASLIAIPYSYIAPNSYVSTNISGTLNVLDVARDLGVSKVIHTSTSEVYGSAQYVPIDEKHPVVGQSPYSATKIAADQLAYSFFASFESPIIIARPFNTFGPRQSNRAVIPTIISQILSDRENISLGSLSPTRDFNYVEDTVNAFIKILEEYDDYGSVVNIGSGYEYSIGHILKKIKELMNVEILIEEDKSRIRPKKSEVDRLLCDNHKILNSTSWKPKYANDEGLSKALRKTIDWFSDSSNLKHYKSDFYNL